MKQEKLTMSFFRRRMQQALFISLLFQGTLIAEESSEEIPTVEVSAEHMANVSSSSRASKRGSDFENWIFAAAAFVTATIAVIIVSLSPGSSVPPADQPL